MTARYLLSLRARLLDDIVYFGRHNFSQHFEFSLIYYDIATLWPTTRLGLRSLWKRFVWGWSLGGTPKLHLPRTRQIAKVWRAEFPVRLFLPHFRNKIIIHFVRSLASEASGAIITLQMSCPKCQNWSKWTLHSNFQSST